MASVKWPRTQDPVAWHVCTAECALALGPNGNQRDYAHFALVGLAKLGRRREAISIISRLEATPPRDQLRRVSEIEAIAKAWLALNDEKAAVRAFEPLLALAKKQRKPSDASFLRTAVVRFRAENGLLPASERGQLTPLDQTVGAFRLAHAALRRGALAEARAQASIAAKSARRAGWGREVVELLLNVKQPKVARTFWESLSKADRESTKAPLLLAMGVDPRAAIKARAEAAMKELVPSEWNVHSVVWELERAFDELRAVGETKQAEALLEVTLERFATGHFDSREFASAAAYLCLSKMVFRSRGWAAAAPLLTRSIEVARRARSAATVDVINALIEMKRFDDASERLATVSLKKRPELLAAIAFASKRWGALGIALRKVAVAERPRVTWRFVSG